MATYNEIYQMARWDMLAKWSRNGIAIPEGRSKKAERIRAFMARLIKNNQTTSTITTAHEFAKQQKSRRGLGIARMADMYFAEHGATRGDYRSTTVLDYVPPEISRHAPYHDHGNAGMALVEITRRRVYPKSYHHGPSFTSERYLCGRNEAGTWYSHRVSPCVATVRRAVAWIWSDMEDRIIQRQGDIALISGNGGPKYPSSGLPSGHEVDGRAGVIVHKTHPAIRVPGKHERIIVARRASQRGDGAATQTRD